MRTSARPATAPRPRARRRIWRIGLLAVVGAGVPVACGADVVRDAAVRELAVGSWRCTVESDDAVYAPMVVEIDDGGTFEVAFQVPADDPAADRSAASELRGTWVVDGGDLDWGFDEPARAERFRVPQFDDLTVDSTEFTLDSNGLFASNPRLDTESALDLPEVIEVEARGTDAVTFRQRGGDPWTCERQ